MQPNANPNLVTQPLEPVTDLCGACAHGDDCHLRDTPIVPLHECNEYDDGSPAITADTKLLKSVPSASAQMSAPASSTLAGLCLNCDHRESCILTRSVGGVWHCEEYQ